MNMLIGCEKSKEILYFGGLETCLLFGRSASETTIHLMSVCLKNYLHRFHSTKPHMFLGHYDYTITLQVVDLDTILQH